MPGMDIVALSSALGRDIDSAEIISLVDTLAAAATGSSPTTRLKAEVSSFPDVTFHNYHPLGVSFSYIPSTVPGQASSSKLVLDRIDIYIADPSSSAAAPPARPGRQPKPTFSRFPLDLSLSFPTTSIALPSPPPAQPCTTSSRDTSPTASTTREREKIFVVRAQTRGRDFVAALGEPSRKGGGSGGVGGFAGVPPWMEWNNVELEVGEPQGNDEVSPLLLARGTSG